MEASRFITPLCSKSLVDDYWELLSPLRYYSGFLGTYIEVPKGFVTDLDSIPRWLPVVYALFRGRTKAAAVVHDYLYQTHKVAFREVLRWEADHVIYEAAGASGPDIEPVSVVSRSVLWSGVRIGGHWSWESGPTRLKIHWDRRDVARIGKADGDLF